MSMLPESDNSLLKVKLFIFWHLARVIKVLSLTQSEASQETIFPITFPWCGGGGDYFGH